MNNDFKIYLEWLEGSAKDPAERASFAQISIIAKGQETTELEDLFARTIRSGLRASAYDLAVWLTENWWRLRWEPEAKTIDWQLSHVVAAAGGGVAWPNVSFASDGVHVLVAARKTSRGRGAPVRYIRDVDVQVSAEAFEAGVDEFVERILARLSSVKVNTDLSSLWKQLMDERHEDKTVAVRRLEALMGFDPDEAPEKLIASLQERINEVGFGAINEVAASEKADSSRLLEDVLQQVKRSRISIKLEPSWIINDNRLTSAELPSQRATIAAKRLRAIWGIGHGPVSNTKISEILSISKTSLESTSTNGVALAAGLRAKQNGAVNIVMRAKVETGRRFEIMRLVADHIASPPDDRLLPVTSAKTDRQKFQRAFAQEILLPFEELHEHLNLQDRVKDDISDDEIDDVASQYKVSPLLVTTTLVNHKFLPRDLLIPTE